MSERQALLDHLLDHYDRPRNYGPLPDADVQLEGGQPDCGDLVTIYLKLDPSGQRAAAIQFEGRGCTISQAAASIISEYFARTELSAILAFDDRALLDLLGREVVQSRPRCATLALHTLQTAAQRAHNARASHEG